MSKLTTMAAAVAVAALAAPIHLAGAASTGVPACTDVDADVDTDVDAAVEADDTERNVRDRDDATRTPMDQGSSEGDMRITTEIRKALMADDDLSMNAKNVKVITVDNVVTLRGPVDSAQERDQIAALARKTPGVARVDNQLEVDVD
jgi:osmotically-inducible protein OsmY